MMASLRLGLALASAVVMTSGFFACVGDSSNPIDAGADTAALDAQDVVTIDAASDVAPDVKPDGGTVLWASSFGGPGDEGANDVTVDKDGNVIVSGTFAGTFPDGGADGAGVEPLVIELDPNGKLRWQTQIAAAGWAGPLATDGSGNVFVGMQVQGPATIPCSCGNLVLSASSGPDAVIAKLNGADGKITNVINFHCSAGVCEPTGIGRTSTGDVIVGGDFTAYITMPDGGTNGANGYDSFVTDINSTLTTPKWMETFYDVGNQRIYDLRVAPNDDILATGIYEQTASWGNGHDLTSAGSYDGFFLRLDTSGTVQDARSIGGSGYEAVYKIAPTSSGAVLAGLFSSSTVSFGSVSVNGSGTADGYVAQLGASPTYAATAARAFTGPGDDRGRAIAELPGGDLAVLGLYSDQALLSGPDGGPTTSVGAHDVWVSRVTGAELSNVWLRHFGSSADENPQAIAVSPDSTIVVVGEFPAAFTIDGFTVNNAGLNDLFVMKFAP